MPGCQMLTDFDLESDILSLNELDNADLLLLDDLPYTMEYEEVLLLRNNPEEKLGLILCQTNEDDISGVFVGEIEANSLAGKDGRVHEGDQILQINGESVSTKDEAVERLSHNDPRIILMVARPAPFQADDTFVDEDYLFYQDCPNFLNDMSDGTAPQYLNGHYRNANRVGCDTHDEDGGTTDTATSENTSNHHGDKDKDSGVGRTDGSTRNEESSEFGDEAPPSRGPCNECDQGYHGSQPSINDVSLSRVLLRRLSNGLIHPTAPTARGSGSDTSSNDVTMRAASSDDKLSSKDTLVPANTPSLSNVQSGEEKRSSGSEKSRRSSRSSKHKDSCGTDSSSSPGNTASRREKRASEGRRSGKGKQRNRSSESPGPVDRHGVKAEENRHPGKSSTSDKQSRSHSEPRVAAMSLSIIPENCLGSSNGVEYKKDSPSPPDRSNRSKNSDSYHRYYNNHSSRSSHCQTNSAVPPRLLPAASQLSVASSVMSYIPTHAKHHRSYLQLVKQQEKQLCDGLRNADGMYTGGDPGDAGAVEWKVKRRSDGTRYITQRPMRNKLLQDRAKRINEERSGLTTDDDMYSEMKTGRYWSKEDRKRQFVISKEQRRRREFMINSRINSLQENNPPAEQKEILELSKKKLSKRKNKKVLDGFYSIQEMLAHGDRDTNGHVVHPLLSVTYV